MPHETVTKGEVPETRDKRDYRGYERPQGGEVSGERAVEWPCEGRTNITDYGKPDEGEFGEGAGSGE